jgi:hypothetical protein
MKRLLTLTLVLALGIILGYGYAFAGNGAPNGAHYNLNIIGVSKDKTADMDGNNGHRIFVPIDRKAKIYLTESDDFNSIQVLDANGTDNNGATFALPNPDPEKDGVTAYSVYVRALGKPGGIAKMQSCYIDEYGDEWCAGDFSGGVEPIEIERRKGKSTFRNVSKDLLYVDLCVLWDANGTCLEVDQVPLFSEEAEGYFWEYDNNGLKVAQFRFYEVPTDTGW